MTRAAYTKTPRSAAFSLWLRDHLKDSTHGLSFGDLDFVFEEYNTKCALLLEVKSENHFTWPAGIKRTHGLIDAALRLGLPLLGYRYWGYYLLQFPEAVPSKLGSIWLNGTAVTLDTLIAHLNFERCAVPGFVFSQRYKTWHDGSGHPIVQHRAGGTTVWRRSKVAVSSLTADAKAVNVMIAHLVRAVSKHHGTG